MGNGCFVVFATFINVQTIHTTVFANDAVGFNVPLDGTPVVAVIGVQIGAFLKHTNVAVAAVIDFFLLGVVRGRVPGESIFASVPFTL
jgi:hypothetical protein